MLALLIVALVNSLLLVAHGLEACDQVNSFIGTGGLGYGYGGINPGAQYPYGALRLGPDTTEDILQLSWRHFSGYNYQDSKIRGFSHTHLVGAGVDDLGNIGVMPLSFSKDFSSGLALDSWWSKFNKTNEAASPGYYSVYLDEPEVKAEMLAISNFAGVHRYTWTNVEDAKAALVIDACHTAKHHYGDDSTCDEGNITIDSENPNVFTAYVNTHGGLSHNLKLYLYAEIVPTSSTAHVDKWTLCTQSGHHPSCERDVTTKSAAKHLYGFATFNRNLVKPQKELTVDLRVGMSFVSYDLAKQNLHSALGDTKGDFDKLLSRTRNFWCDTLSYLSVTSIPGDDEILPMLYSASYRSLMSPTNYTESGGVYLGVDKLVHNAEEERKAKYGTHQVPTGLNSASSQYIFFSDLSFWDTFRTQHPWLFLVNEDLSMGIARSITEITLQQNAFPRWVLGSTEASCMIGNHGAAFIVEAMLSGFGAEFDATSIQAIFAKQLTQPWPINGRTDLDRYLSEGYVAQEVSGRASSLTLTYAFDDYLLGVMSQQLNDTSSADAAFARSKNYQKIWSQDQTIFCPKYADGRIECPSDPTNPLQWNYYTEGDAYHWSWFVPHDVEGLIALHGSPEVFNTNLGAFLANHVPYHEKFKSPVPNPYYWAGNEHDFLAPWLFNYGPQCTNTQYWTRKLTQMHFSNTAHGIPGNDDYGSMSTWLLFASLGLFPQAGTTRFLIGSPRVASASIQLKHWNRDPTTLQIVTYDNTAENTYIQKLLVNGQELTQPFIDRSVLATGDVKLEFFMQATPASGLCANAKA